MNYYLAIDIGASSGRHIVGWMENNEIKTDEVYRFHNETKTQNKYLVWDVDSLFENVKKGIKAALKKYPVIKSLAIDTWGVDYILFTNCGQLTPCLAYRDNRTESVIDKVHNIIPFEELYSMTGIQFQPFNTIYQMYDDKERGRLDVATDFLMIPEYLNYMLTGVKMHEYTNATTTGLVNAATGEYDKEIIQRLGYPGRFFTKLYSAGTRVGSLTDEVACEVGGQIDVVLCASHDTASAVYGIPLDEYSLYISSGTWSLLGVTIDKPLTDFNSMQANYSNEGGINKTVRYQKNIMGMWVVNRLREELCPDTPFTDIVEQSRKSTFGEYVDVNDSVFLSPKSMKEAFDSKLTNKPTTEWDFFRCAYISLAISYKKAIDELKANTHKTYNKLYIVGGGAKNTFLNELTEKATKLQVIALPIEATAIGNLKIQMESN